MSPLNIGSCFGVGSATSFPSVGIANVTLTTTVKRGLLSTSGQRKVVTANGVLLAI
jgi:hypothetical protein